MKNELVLGKRKVALIAAIGLTAIASVALAHSGATGIVKKRMNSMKSIAGSMKAISQLDWNRSERARDGLRKNAEAVRMHASHIVKMFPEGSIRGPSEAIPAIWEKPDEFARLAEQLETRAAELAAMAPDVSSADAIKPQLISLGETCKACHEGFRKKKR